MHGGGADLHFVLAGVFAGGGVDDEGHVLVFHQVDDVGALAAGEFGEDVHGDVGFGDDGAGAGGGVEVEAEIGVAFGDAGEGGFVGVFDANEDVATGGEGAAGGHLAFGEGHAEVVVDAHDFAGAFHFGAEDDVDAEEFAEGEDGFFDAVMGGDDFFGEAELFEGFAGHDLGGEFGERDADGFADEGRGAGGAGVDFDDVEVVAFDGELHVHQAADVEGFGELLGGVADAVLHGWREAEGRDDAGAVAGVDACLFDVLHDGTDDGGFAVADAIDIDLGGVFEEAVDEEGFVGGDDGFVGREGAGALLT